MLLPYVLLMSVGSAPVLAAASLSRVSIPLKQHQGQRSPSQHAQHVAARYASGTSSFATEAETLDAGFWYGTFSVGNANNLSLLIDTGSADVAVNPGLYKPSNSFRNLSANGTLQYSTADENGCGTASVAYNTFTDVVSQAGLVAKNQSLGNIVAKTPPNSGVLTQFPHDGIVGFGVPPVNETQLGGSPFFQSLCDQGAVSECRFGLALGTSGSGQQVLGGVDDQLLQGNLSVASSDASWDVQGINVAVNGTVILTNQTAIFDSGTANIVGPPDQVQTLYDALGIKGYFQNNPSCTSTLFGYYPCNSPPAVGFQFAGLTHPIFQVEPAAFQQADNGNNNCTAIITGILFEPGLDFWIIGQAFMQGKYLDFNAEGGNYSVGIAQLRGDNATATVSIAPTATSTTAPATSTASSGARRSYGILGFYR